MSTRALQNTRCTLLVLTSSLLAAGCIMDRENPKKLALGGLSRHDRIVYDI